MKVEADRIRQIMPIRYKTGTDSNVHMNEIDSCKSSSERQSRESGGGIRRKRETRSSYNDKKCVASKQRFRYGSFIYCIVNNNIEADLNRLDIRGKILISICRPCPQIHENTLINDKAQVLDVETATNNAKLVAGTCRFRSKLFVLEFASSSSFTIRNPENQNIEWGKVIFF